MADDIILDENGVPMSDGNGGTTTTDDSNTGQGGGSAGPTTTSSTLGTSTSSGTSGTSTSSGTSNDFNQKEEEVDKILASWMAISAIGLAFDDVVKLYVENKLGFGKNGEALKKKYKEDNPDMDPDEIDKEVDAQLKATTEEFTKSGSQSKEELQAKYNEFKTASFEALGNLQKMAGELAKTIANAYMPTSIGPVAPNPLSIALKLYVGLTALKKLLDRVVISMTVLMAAARSIGADKSQPYKVFINQVHSLLDGIMKQVKDEEEAGDNLKNVAKAEYLLEVKKNYFVTAPNETDTIGYKIIEEIARNDFSIYIWPLGNGDINKLYNIINVNPVVSMIPGIGVIVGVIDLTTNDTLKERKAKMLLAYNNALVNAAIKFEQDYQIQLESENNNTTSTINSSGGTNDTSSRDVGTYGLAGLDKKGTK